MTRPIPRALPLALGALLSLLLLLPAAAAAAGGTVRLASDRFTVSEGDGHAVITVVRSDGSGRGAVRYAVLHSPTAIPGQDFQRTRGRVDFEPGQTEATFTVPIIDDALVERDEDVKVTLYGAHPMRLVEPRQAWLTIVDDDEVASERDAANPLMLDPPPTNGNPLAGARFFVDPDNSLAGLVARRIRRRNPRAAQLLRVIAEQPESKRFGSWNAQPRQAVSNYLQQAHAKDPGAIPLLATYRLKHLRCGNVADSEREVAAYKRWYDQFAAGIGNHRVVLFYEIDALITTKCLSRVGLQRRIEQVSYAIDVLSRLPHAVVYVDAGSGLAHSPRYIANLLWRVGVHKIQGFFTNATHQNWTSREIRYGRTLVRLLGGRPHYVVNTSGNGRGPLVPRDRVRYGNSIRCNAPGRGLGPRPTSDVPARYRNLDGLFWIGNPGRSAGRCVTHRDDAPPTGVFWLEYALELVRNADFRIR